MMTRTLLLMTAIVMFAMPAWGQTTQPSDKPALASIADQAWPRAVEAFTKTLTDGDLVATEGALTPGVVVRRFDGVQSQELWRMAERAVKSTVIGQHAYIHPPLVMAADLASDFKNAASVPDKVKAKFIVDDESDIKRANATAVQWVVEQLKVRDGTPVGVIVLWAPRPVAPGIKSAEPQAFDALFVLCRGEELAGHQFKINTVIYGEPVAKENR
jgi:hypothetical protein